MNKLGLSGILRRWAVLGAIAAIQLLIASPQALADVLFTDDMESGVNGWTTSIETQGSPVSCVVEWNQDTSDSHSASTQWTNQPYNQAGNADPLGGPPMCINNLRAPAINMPANISAVTLDFWHRYNTEADFDSGVVQASTNGTNWFTVSTRYNGTSVNNGVDWVHVTLSLEGYYIAGGPLHLRFRFYSDELLTTVVGWHIDDVTVSGEFIIPVEEAHWGTIKARYRD